MSDLDRHIETLLRVIHSRNLAWSDLSEVGKQVDRPLTDVEQLLTNVGDDAHEITLATETIITALKLQRDALAIQSSRRRTRFGSVAKIVKLEHAWRRLDGRNDDGFQVAPFPG
uniref:hypothetical protein n=1 Tax=Sphingobium wenxiniae (strain DSM 21828 / CGMCC 1.7748 / JZ-1) TaxID=595605 RepID=UPI001EECE34B|nr:hypothetical protein [Sphingobium wenxiniae]